MERSIVLLNLILWAAMAFLAPGVMLQVQAQSQSGFISVDCGAPNPYTDNETSINFVTDKGFIDTGENMKLSAINPQSGPWWNYLRSFPNGARNCYTLKPDKGKGNTYLIRASFWYGNYDGKNQPPIFDLYIDVNYWATVDKLDKVRYDIVYVAQRDGVKVCLVNIGKGVPLISALELRTLDNSIYQIESGFLMRILRYDVGGSNSTVRYPADAYDRLWEGWTYSGWLMLNPATSASDLSNNNDAYKVPGEVLRTAQVAWDTDPNFYFYVTPNNWPSKLIGYFHFAETQSSLSRQREFAFSTNVSHFKETVRLQYSKPVTVVSPVVSTTVSGSRIIFFFNASATMLQSGGPPPPILNALEIFYIQELPNVPTAGDDAKAINDTKATYRVDKESWQGDPCVPRNYTWDGLNCSYVNPPRIISLNLSSSNLVGNIASSFSKLVELESLDLSNNQLSGEIPEILAKLPKLTNLNLSGNKLTGSVPKALLTRRDADKTFNLSLDGNPDLCQADPCPRKKNEKSITVPVVAAVLAVLVVLLCALATNCLIKRKPNTGLNLDTLRIFKYSDILEITRNLENAIGEGASGTVYRGELEGKQVAVKVLSKLSGSKSSEKPYKLFQDEARLLAKVHHGNLVSLRGYCHDPEKMALVCEFMANGNLQVHLSGQNDGEIVAKPELLTWGRRLQIAVDVAQGLDYLHHRCVPHIIHRDIKAANILLNENMEAKISDFGLSRALEAANVTYKSTGSLGTGGYIPPEYKASSRELSNKSDVYSFGIVLFELISGHPALNIIEGKSVLVRDWAIPIFQSGDMRRLIDPKVKKFDIESAQKVAEVAVSCTLKEPDARPDISHVLKELNCARDLASNKNYEDENQGVTSLEVESDGAPLVRQY